MLQVQLALLPRARWTFTRLFAAAHLLAMYLAVVAALPGLELQRAAPRCAAAALRLLGLWRPAPRAAMLPVLVAMLLVCSLHRPRQGSARRASLPARRQQP